MHEKHQNRRLPLRYSQHKVASTRGSGRARDVVWRGGAVHLHPEAGSAFTELHAHFAIQITIGLQYPISIRSRRNAQKQISGGWLIASNQPHCIQADGGYITIFVDPLSANGRRFGGRLGGVGMLALLPEEREAAERELRSCLQPDSSTDDVRHTVDRIIQFLTPGVIDNPELDLRVQTVVNELIADPSEHVSLRTLAASVRLSESRLAHLFRREVGIPIRQYRLHLRMQEAITKIAAGRSLTESAHMAGFADSSQFCRICKRMFGSSPSGLPSFQLKEHSL